jgi:hypothetical protein
MSDVGDALSGGGSSASGVTDQTFSDATLGDQIMGGSGDFGGSTSAAGPTEFNQFSDIANALSSGAPAGASPTAAQSVAMNPPSAAAQTGGDPVGAASGTQSATTPGSAPANSNQPQPGQGQQQQQQDHAPPSAVAELKTLLKQLSGKPIGPTGPLPTLAPGQTGPQSPQMPLPTLAAGQTGRPSFTPAMIGGMPNEGGIANLPTLAAGETGPPSGRTPGDALDQVAGAPPAAASIPPGAAQQPSAAVSPPGGGRDITVRKAAPQAMPFPQNEPGEVAPGGPALPTRKPTQPPEAAQPTETEQPPQAAPQPTPPPPRLLQDITGASTGAPIPLAELAQVAMALLPLIGMFGGGRGGRGRRPGFQGMRGFRPFGSPGGFRGGFHPGRFGHPAWRGEWPYHHPQHGWHMHPFHPGGGWLPLNPAELQGMMGGGQQGGPGGPGGNQGGRDPNNPPQQTEAGAGQPDDTFQKSGFSANPFIDALVKQESGGGQNIVSKTDMDSQGRTLAQGGNPNEISQGYFQIQNHPGGTWDTYARQAGVDINKYPTPRSAPLAVQWQVAQRIPIGQWGPQTKAILRQKFGQFDPNMPFGQVASKFGPAGGRLAAATPSRTQPAWASGPTSAGLQLPVTSQPIVAGGP